MASSADQLPPRDGAGTAPPVRHDGPRVIESVAVGQVPAPPDISIAPAPTYPSRGTLARWVMAALALYGVGWLLWQAGTAMIPFIIGLILAYLLHPVVNWLAQRMKRPFAILVVYLGGIALTALGILFLVPPLVDQVQRLVTNIPSVDEGQDLGNRLLQQYRQALPDNVQEPVDRAVASALTRVQENAGRYAQQVGEFIATASLEVVNTLTFLIGFLIIPIWLFYILNDQAAGKAFINRLLHPRLRPDFWNVWRMINKVFSDYIRGQLLLGLAVGLCVGIGLLLLRVLGFDTQYILLLAVIAGITELIPIIGPIIGALPAIAIALFSDSDPMGNTLAVVTLYVIIQQVENNFLVPRIVGESVGVHPAILTVVLIAMGQVFGLLGFILSAPLTAIAHDLYMYAYRRFGGTAPGQALRKVFADKESVDVNAVNEPDPKQSRPA